MKVAFIPLLRTGANYWVNVGRGWSVLEHMLLLALAKNGRTVDELSATASLPGKLVIEALINLLRANFIEIRASGEQLSFQATPLGRSQAKEPQLTARQVPAERWTSLCLDRVTGRWFRTDDLALLYDQDLPADAPILPWTHGSFDPSDGRLRELLYVKPDETLQADEARLRKPSTPYARITLRHGRLEGLPPYAGQELPQAVREFMRSLPELPDDATAPSPVRTVDGEFRTDISPDDLFVGGADQLRLVRESLQAASTSVFLHSCFVDANTIRLLLPDLAAAAARKVNIDLLWGLNRPEDGEDVPAKVTDARKVLNELPPAARAKVRLSPKSSGSHAKVIVYDDKGTGNWVAVVGTCNFLSTIFDAVDVAVRLRSEGLAARLLTLMLSMQVPPAGSWPPVARRLDNAWAATRRRGEPERGTHGVDVLTDGDHYAAVRTARDDARYDIVVACDLLGRAAETSAFVPLEEAARDGTKVGLFYFRPSEALQASERVPSNEDMAARGMALTAIPDLHAKLLAWDFEDLIVTSFNWLATTVVDTYARGAEIGVRMRGDGVRRMLGEKLSEGSLRDALLYADQPVGAPST